MVAELAKVMPFASIIRLCPACNGRRGFYEPIGSDGQAAWEECPVCNGTGTDDAATAAVVRDQLRLRIEAHGRTFGPVLKESRERAGLSQSRMARTIGCDHSYVSRLEAGVRKPSLAFVEIAAAVLELDADAATAFYHAAGFVCFNYDHSILNDPDLLELAKFLADDDIEEELRNELRDDIRLHLRAAVMASLPPHKRQPFV
jgi:transcriptional regulator with XRE-family HTH domain